MGLWPVSIRQCNQSRCAKNVPTPTYIKAKAVVTSIIILSFIYIYRPTTPTYIKARLLPSSPHSSTCTIQRRHWRLLAEQVSHRQRMACYFMPLEAKGGLVLRKSWKAVLETQVFRWRREQARRRKMPILKDSVTEYKIWLANNAGIPLQATRPYSNTHTPFVVSTIIISFYVSHVNIKAPPFIQWIPRFSNTMCMSESVEDARWRIHWDADGVVWSNPRRKYRGPLHFHNPALNPTHKPCQSEADYITFGAHCLKPYFKTVALTSDGKQHDACVLACVLTYDF